MLKIVSRPSEPSLLRDDRADHPMELTAKQASGFVERWVAAWNSHDLDAILSLYRDDIEFSSPFVPRVDDDDPGLLFGKQSLGEYFASALERFPKLTLEVTDVAVGPGTVTVDYRGIAGLLTTEKMWIDTRGQVRRVKVEYRTRAA